MADDDGFGTVVLDVNFLSGFSLRSTDSGDLVGRS